MIEVPHQVQGDFTEVLSLSVETTAVKKSKLTDVIRVVLTNQLGELLLDTLVKPIHPLESLTFKKVEKYQLLEFAH